MAYNLTTTTCHDCPCTYAMEHPQRICRASYACPLCGKDISLHVLIYEQAKADATKVNEALTSP